MSKVKPTNVATDRVKSIVERVERLEEERKAIGADIRDIYAEAKGTGFDVKTLRWLVSERKVETSDRNERDSLRATYAHALGLAVELVEVNGLSLRQAERRTGLSKSSIHRALTVPKESQPATPFAQPDGPGSDSKSRSPAISSSDSTEPVEPARKDGCAGEREPNVYQRLTGSFSPTPPDDGLDIPTFLLRPLPMGGRG